MSLIKAFEKQKNREEVVMKPVACPICSKMVNFKYINMHIDSGCTLPTSAPPLILPTISATVGAGASDVAIPPLLLPTAPCNSSINVSAANVADVETSSIPPLLITSTASPTPLLLTTRSARRGAAGRHCDMTTGGSEVNTRGEESKTTDQSTTSDTANTECAGMANVNDEAAEVKSLRAVNIERQAASNIVEEKVEVQTAASVIRPLLLTSTSGPTPLLLTTTAAVSGGIGRKRVYDDASGDTAAAGVSDVEDDGQTTRPSAPAYYLLNFITLIDGVLSNELYKHLFNDDDHAKIQKFRDLSADAQKLYVRVFLRKHTWIVSNKMKYAEISDKDAALQELVNAEMLLDHNSISDVRTILPVLSTPQLKVLCKRFHIKLSAAGVGGVGGGGARRADMIELLLAHTRTQRHITDMMTSTAAAAAAAAGDTNTNTVLSAMAAAVLKCGVELVCEDGGCYHLSEPHRELHTRLALLHSLPHVMVEDDPGGGHRGGGSSALTIITLSNMGRLTYPKYNVRNYTIRIFPHRDAVIRYKEAKQLYYEMVCHMESGEWQAAHDVYETARHKLYGTDIYRNTEALQHDRSLPAHLRPLTALSVLTKVVWLGCESLERLRLYDVACECLSGLLDQTDYCGEYRGKWYDRLAVNLHQHLRRVDECVDVISRALSEPHLRRHYKLSLYLRALKIYKAGSTKQSLRDKIDALEKITYREAPKVYIEGRLFPREMSGYKNLFITEGSYTAVSHDDIHTCGVEQLVLEHYRGAEPAYKHGTHGEGSTLTTIMWLLMWEVMLCDEVHNVFISPYQSAPLDLRYTTFYTSRRKLVDDSLAWIETADTQSLCDVIEERWQSEQGTTCLGLQWDRFDSVQQVKELVTCVGGVALSAIFSRFIKCGAWSGFPDLTVWNTVENTYKIIEVKGPGDRLSVKQLLWLDYLTEHDIPCEVCYVKAVSSKKLKSKR